MTEATSRKPFRGMSLNMGASLGAASACAAEHENVHKDEFPAAYERERSVWMPEAPQVSALQNHR